MDVSLSSKTIAVRCNLSVDDLNAMLTYREGMIRDDRLCCFFCFTSSFYSHTSKKEVRAGFGISSNAEVADQIA